MRANAATLWRSRQVRSDQGCSPATVVPPANITAARRPPAVVTMQSTRR
jgi:hypothetical protein